VPRYIVYMHDPVLAFIPSFWTMCVHKLKTWVSGSMNFGEGGHLDCIAQHVRTIIQWTHIIRLVPEGHNINEILLNLNPLLATQII
jgi:hypothetical protein